MIINLLYIALCIAVVVALYAWVALRVEGYDEREWLEDSEWFNFDENNQ